MDTQTNTKPLVTGATNYVAVRAVATCPSCSADFRVVRDGAFQLSCPSCNWQPEGGFNGFWDVLSEVARNVSNGQGPIEHRFGLRPIGVFGTTDIEIQIYAERTKATCPWCDVNLPDSEIASHLLEGKLRFACTGCSRGVPITNGMTAIKAGLPYLVFILSRPAWIGVNFSNGKALVRCSSCNTTISAGKTLESACPDRCQTRPFHNWDYVLGLGQEKYA